MPIPLTVIATLAITTTVIVAVLTAALAGAARRAGLSRRLAPVAGGLAVAWLVAVACVAGTGVLSDWNARPPRWPMLPLTALLAFVGFNLTGTFRTLLRQIPPWQPVALQTFRVAVEIAFWRLHAHGLAPVQVTFEGRNLDILVGLTAPLVAAGVASGRLGARATVAWNVAGLLLLANAVATVATSVPGPLHGNWAGDPFTAVARWPVVWIPAFLAPLAAALHVASLRQAVQRALPVAFAAPTP